MTVTIRFRLSETGQKASILAGGDGRRVQTIIVAREDPEFAAAVATGTPDRDGNILLDYDYYGAPEWDVVPTVRQILDRADADRAVQAAEQAADSAATAAATRRVITERLTTVVQLCDLDGVRHDYHEPNWPYPRDQSVIDAEASPWLAELAAEKADAKLRRDEANVIIEARMAVEAAEREKLAEEESARRAEKRAALGLDDADLVLSVEDGALTTVPTGCWESHSRGKNWLALITPDPASPGGLARRFAAKAKGSSYYLLPDLSVGDAIEFGADYYTGGGRKNPHRWYGFYVRTLDDGSIVLRKCSTGKGASKAGRAYAAEHAPQPDAIDDVIARVNAEGVI